MKEAEKTGEKRVFVDINSNELDECDALNWVLNLIDDYLHDYELEKNLEANQRNTVV